MDRTVTFTETTVGALVAALDPQYNARETGYSFSNGKKFAGPEYDNNYDFMIVEATSYVKSVPDRGLLETGKLEILDGLEIFDNLEML